MSQTNSSPAEAEAAFYRAFRELDLSGMQGVWADMPSIYCLHPSGQLSVGREAVISSWAAIFEGSKPPKIEYSLISELQQSDMAVHLLEERIGGDQILVLVTHVYVQVGDSWRMFSHHASKPHPNYHPLPTGRSVH
jgi:hypothetical protein